MGESKWYVSHGHFSLSHSLISHQDNAVRQKKVEENIVQNVSPLRIGRSGTGVDIAYAALFLASDDSVWMTGQVGVCVFLQPDPDPGWGLGEGEGEGEG